MEFKFTCQEPDQKMIRAGIDSWINQTNPNKPINFAEIYKAMWRAAPTINQEPFGYVRLSPGEDSTGSFSFSKSECVGATPVYIRPQPTQDINADLLDALRDCASQITRMINHGEWYYIGETLDTANALIARAQSLEV